MWSVKPIVLYILYGIVTGALTSLAMRWFGWR